MSVNSTLGILLGTAGIDELVRLIAGPDRVRAIVSKLNTLLSFQGNSGRCAA